MTAPRNVLVYEFISAGGMDGDEFAPGDFAELLDQGSAMRDALLADLQADPELAVAVALQPGAAWRGSARPLWARPGEAAAEFLARTAGGFERIWVVAPESGGILAELYEAVGAARWVGCDGAAIRLTASKTATRRHLAGREIAVPGEYFGAADELGPWLVKPDDGAGALETIRHRRLPDALADVAERVAAGRECTLERWVDGDPLSLSLKVREGRAELLSINRQAIQVAPDGRLHYRGVDCGALPLTSPRAAELAGLAQRIAAAVPGLAGFVGVDLVMGRDGRPVVIEINPRLTSAYVGLSARLGRRLASELLGCRPAVEERENACA